MSAQTDPSQSDPALTELAKGDPAITSDHEPHAEVTPSRITTPATTTCPPPPMRWVPGIVDVYYGDFRACPVSSAWRSTTRSPR